MLLKKTKRNLISKFSADREEMANKICYSISKRRKKMCLSVKIKYFQDLPV